MPEAAPSRKPPKWNKVIHRTVMKHYTAYVRQYKRNVGGPITDATRDRLLLRAIGETERGYARG